MTDEALTGWIKRGFWSQNRALPKRCDDESQKGLGNFGAAVCICDSRVRSF